MRSLNPMADRLLRDHPAGAWLFPSAEARQSALGRHVLPNSDDAMAIRVRQC
jgi:hypothetical protein